MNIMKLLFFKLGIWCLTKYFKYIDIYSPGEMVSAITFSNSEKFIDYVGKFKNSGENWI